MPAFSHTLPCISDFSTIPISHFPSISQPWHRRANPQRPKAREVFPLASDRHSWMPVLDETFSLGKKEKPVPGVFGEWSKASSSLLPPYSPVLPLHSSNSHGLPLLCFPHWAQSPFNCCSLSNSWALRTLPPNSRAANWFPQKPQNLPADPRRLYAHFLEVWLNSFSITSK